MTKWDTRFLDLAERIAAWSKDPTTKVGAVIVRDDRTLASVGFNGFPRGVEDSEERLHDRDTKLAMTVHAEVNAILSAHEPVKGHTLYVSPLFCCANCAAAIVQSGIRRVVARSKGDTSRWQASFDAAGAILREGGVEFTVERTS